MSLGGLGWAYECKDGASPLRPMTRGEAAVVLVKTLNPKPARHPTAYAVAGVTERQRRL